VRRHRIEICSVGTNPNLQLVGSDPAGGVSDLGLFIGANGNDTARTNRQLYVLAVKRFNAAQRGRVVGFRQYLTMLAQLASPNGATYPLERPIITPTWKYVDGNAMWGIRMIPPETHFHANTLNADGFAYVFTQTSAQLFQSVSGGGVITPPYGGTFPGNVLTPELGRFTDIRCTDWSRPVDCDLSFEGPCDIAFFASVQQTNPATRTPPPVIACSRPIPVSQQINGNLALPLNSAVEHWIVVTTSGGVGVIGDLYFDNGLNDGNPVAIIPPFTGESIIPSTNFTGGTITLNAGQIYTWGGSGFNPSFPQSQFLTTQGTTPEDAFLQNYPGSTYGRIAGSLIFELDEEEDTPEVIRTQRQSGMGAAPETPTLTKSVVNALIQRWRTGFGPPPAPVKPRGVGTTPKDTTLSDLTIQQLAKKWRGPQ
jgi:hypothetical protein